VVKKQRGTKAVGEKTRGGISTLAKGWGKWQTTNEENGVAVGKVLTEVPNHRGEKSCVGKLSGGKGTGSTGEKGRQLRGGGEGKSGRFLVSGKEGRVKRQKEGGGWERRRANALGVQKSLGQALSSPIEEEWCGGVERGGVRAAGYGTALEGRNLVHKRNRFVILRAGVARCPAREFYVHGSKGKCAGNRADMRKMGKAQNQGGGKWESRSLGDKTMDSGCMRHPGHAGGGGNSRKVGVLQGTGNA